MKKDKIEALFCRFEAIVHHEGHVAFWLARELQGLLGYSKWSNFEQVLDRAKDACRGAGHAVA
ncbi:MAG: DNA damage-inducible protein D, partial [Planctomycetota bacterium]